MLTLETPSEVQADPTPTAYLGYLPPVGFVPVAEAFADPSIQRNEEECISLRNKIKEEFNPNAFGACIVNRRSVPFNGISHLIYSIIDGQNRWIVAKELSIRNIPAIVHDNLTILQEAELFVTTNKNRKPVSAIRLWESALLNEDPEVVGIQDILNDYNIVIKKSREPWASTAVTTFGKMYRTDTLNTTLSTILSMWSPEIDENVLNSYTLMGFSGFLQNDWRTVGGGIISGREAIDKIINHIKLRNYSPNDIFRAVKNRNVSASGGDIQRLIPLVLADFYNASHRGRHRIEKMAPRKGRGRPMLASKETV